MFLKIGVLKNLANFTGKNLCWSLFLLKGHLHRCFPVKFLKFLRTTFLQNTSSVATLSRVILRRAFHMHFRSSHQGCSKKKVFLEISQYSQESTCARVFFLIMLQVFRPATL